MYSYKDLSELAGHTVRVDALGYHSGYEEKQI
jgi:hypothetical protein